MINFNVKRIYLARETVDMRKSFNTLEDLVKFNLEKDPYSGDAFVFIGKRKNRLKILLWEEGGFWLCTKRLEKGTFNYLSLLKANHNSETITAMQWHSLLEGIVVLKSKKLKRYKKN